uniref:hypothetical protein n=1 Tax=Caballeronia sp. LjRoot34 TaxID=3342325 RepID=UPI003F50D019
MLMLMGNSRRGREIVLAIATGGPQDIAQWRRTNKPPVRIWCLSTPGSGWLVAVAWRRQAPMTVGEDGFPHRLDWARLCPDA